MKDIRIGHPLLAALILACICSFTAVAHPQSSASRSEQGTAGEPYPNMPSIPPIGVRTAKYFDIPALAQGPAVDPVKGYRLQDFGSGLYMITDNQIQSMFRFLSATLHDFGSPRLLTSFSRAARE
jgi:hypothetical protein